MSFELQLVDCNSIEFFISFMFGRCFVYSFDSSVSFSFRLVQESTVEYIIDPSEIWFGLVICFGQDGVFVPIKHFDDELKACSGSDGDSRGHNSGGIMRDIFESKIGLLGLSFDI